MAGVKWFYENYGSNIVKIFTAAVMRFYCIWIFG